MVPYLTGVSWYIYFSFSEAELSPFYYRIIWYGHITPRPLGFTLRESSVIHWNTAIANCFLFYLLYKTSDYCPPLSLPTTAACNRIAKHWSWPWPSLSFSLCQYILGCQTKLDCCSWRAGSWLYNHDACGCTARQPKPDTACLLFYLPICQLICSTSDHSLDDP